MNRIVIALVLASVFCGGQAQNLQGTYRSNFALADFFITQIKFTSDSTFDYVFSGDLVHNEFSGIYVIRHEDVYLLFNEGEGPTIKLDSAEAKELESLGMKVGELTNSNYHGYEIKQESGIRFHMKYKFENGRLYVYRVDNGQLVRTDKFYNGVNWVSKDCYLERVD